MGRYCLWSGTRLVKQRSNTCPLIKGKKMKHNNCRIAKATREPLYGYNVDWIIEENVNYLICAVRRSEKTDIYPYNKVFEIEVCNKGVNNE